MIVADTYNNKVRKVTRQGTVSTIAGNGTTGQPSFGGSPLRSALNRPNGVLALADGRLLIADSWGNAVYSIDEKGVLRAFAGKPNRAGYQGLGTFTGDGGPATEAGMNTPIGLAEDRNGNVYISVTFNHRIREVDAVTGRIRTVAGATQGFAPAGKLLNYPVGVAVLDKFLLVADSGNRIIVPCQHGRDREHLLLAQPLVEKFRAGITRGCAGAEKRKALALDIAMWLYVTDRETYRP